MTDFEKLKDHAKSIRINALKIISRSRASHIGSGYSCVELLTFLYGNWLNVSPQGINHPDRDRFILSKGHAAAVYYSVLAEFGFISMKDLDSYCQFGSLLGGHVHHAVAGVEISTGSLGHGLPIAVGMALAAKRNRKRYRVVALLSDGEMEEGSNWEALNMASAQRLDNLTVVVDKNGLQAMGFVKDILPMDNLGDRINSFGCAAQIIDGHNVNQIDLAFQGIPFIKNKPSVLIANTIKGKGVSFMENKLEWHYRSPNEEQYQKALKELESV
ncbi:MAG: transketolase [Candidatus Omnitrophota bacterium]